MKALWSKYRNNAILAFHLTVTTTILTTLYYMVKNKIDNPNFQNKVKKDELMKIEELKQGKRVCIVGAGPSGLVTSRYMLSEGMEPIIFEQSDSLGGTWVFRNENTEYCQNSCYRSLSAITAKWDIEFFDFPGPNLALMPTWKQMNEYLHSFSNHFGITKRIYLNNSVTSISHPSENQNIWQVTVKDTKLNTENTYEFDYVVVCTGLFNKPRRITLNGEESFSGKRIHSKDYKIPNQFNGLNVLIIGGGESGQQIAKELNKHASKVYLSTKNPNPDFELFKFGYSQKPSVSKIDQNKVQFIDGSETPIDAIIECTGYNFEFPFLQIPGKTELYRHARFENSDVTWLRLYKHVFPVQEERLAFVGFITISLDIPSSIHHIFENQAMTVSQKFSKNIDFDTSIMKEEIEFWESKKDFKYDPMMVDEIKYTKELKKLRKLMTQSLLENEEKKEKE